MKTIVVNYNNKHVKSEYWTSKEFKDDPEYYDSLYYLGRYPVVGEPASKSVSNQSVDLFYDYEGDYFVSGFCKSDK